MAYVPSHQELKDHPKTKRAARRADVTLPTMIGHLHLLWWWALDHAPTGDLSRFDAEDLADGAMWDGDPETFVKALVDCGPGESEGFLTSEGYLHDWDDYGGKYVQRVQAARKAAEARWHPNGNAPAEPPQSDRNADASGAHAGGNADKRRGDKRTKSKGTTARGGRLPDGWAPKAEPELQATAQRAGVDLRAELAKFRDYWAAQPGAKGRKVDWQATWRNWVRRAMERPSKPNAPPTVHNDVCPDCEQVMSRHDPETCEAIKAVNHG